MQIQRENKNRIFADFERYKHEIQIDTNESIIKSTEIIARKTLLHLGNNEIHHIIKYHQKIVLNSLFFRDKSILFEYQEWLYRVYYHKNTDLDFFKYLIECFQNICNKYIDVKSCIDINEYYKYVLDKHEFFKKEASKKKRLIDNVEESEYFSKLLISGDKEKAYGFIKEKASDLESFLVFYNEVISNAMKNVGYLWENSEISVAKEHIASNTLNDIVIRVLDEYPAKDRKGIHLFLSSAPHESHGQGISIASRVYEKLGYKVTNLGTSIPAKDIKKAIIEFQPDFIILAATLRTSLLDIAYLTDDIVKDKDIYAKPIKIGIAGAAFEKMPHPVKTFKADFHMKSLDDISAF